VTDDIEVQDEEIETEDYDIGRKGRKRWEQLTFSIRILFELLLLIRSFCIFLSSVA